MNTADITEPLFRQAVKAIDEGEKDRLASLLESHPGVVRQRLDTPVEGYFRHPYLLWFIADNPIRVERLPANIVAIAELIIQAVRQGAPDLLQQQLDYALGLVATGRIPKECGVQPALIDLLIDEGAAPGDGIGALANGNPDAAQHLIRRGGEMTLAAAAGLGLDKEVDRLFPLAGKSERELAIVVAAFYGREGMLSRLIGPGIDINAYPDGQSGFHSHATALHQAVSSGSLPAVKILVEAGADVRLGDHIYHGTPLGWAEFLLKEEQIGEEHTGEGQIGEERTGEGQIGEERTGEGHSGEGHSGAVKRESLNKIADYLRKLDERRL